MRIIAGQDQAIADWAGMQLNVRFQEPFTAFGFVDKTDAIRGACIFNDYYKNGNLEITYVGPQSLSRGILKFLIKFAFNELKASRVTAKTRRSNVIVRRLLPKFGFDFENTQKRYFGGCRGDDALVFVLWPHRADRWLK